MSTHVLSSLDLDSVRMTLHYVAAAQIVLAIIFHLARGGQSAAIEDSMDRRVTLPALLYSWYFTLGFFLGSAVVIVLPGAPGWLKISISVMWLLLGVGNLVSARARETLGYFGLSTGTLILLGEIL